MGLTTSIFAAIDGLQDITSSVIVFLAALLEQTALSGLRY